MSYSVRLASFIFLSLLLHLAVLRVELFQNVEFQQLHTTGVGVVVSSAQQFLPDRLQRKEMAGPRKKIVNAQKPSLAQRQSMPAPKPSQPVKKNKPLPSVKPVSKTVKSHAAPLMSQESLQQKIVEKPLPSTQLHTTEHVVDELLPPQAAAVILISSPGEAKSAVQAPDLIGSDIVNQQAKPRYALNTPPAYPASAHRKGWEGRVVLDVLVKVNGRVTDLEIFRSSGHRILDRAALKAVSRWKFKPAISLGRPVESRVQVPINFSLLE